MKYVGQPDKHWKSLKFNCVVYLFIWKNEILKQYSNVCCQRQSAETIQRLELRTTALDV